MHRLCALAAALLLAPFSTAVQAPARAAPRRVKVFLLAGQSNMEGQGAVTMKDEAGHQKPGTLVSMAKDPATAPLLQRWLDAKGDWAEQRDDVWIFDVNENGERHGRLAFGYGFDLGSRDWFGPELPFGDVVGDHFDEPVLIVKTAWGGKDLYKDFRPPSAGGTTGPCYTEMVATVKRVVRDWKTLFPEVAADECELCGFVWWHGWNDFCSPDHGAPEYEKNLANLIRDLRRDLATPKLPVVIGEFTGPWGADCKEPAAVTIRKAQQAVAELPEFAATVTFVPTHDFVRAAKDSPSDETYHEFKNGETYFRIGDAFGKAMVKLLAK